MARVDKGGWLQEENERRIKLYEQGFNDREIAEKLGLTSQSIWYWRKEYGLPPKEPHKPSRKKWVKVFHCP